MDLQEQPLRGHYDDDQQTKKENAKPNAYRVDDDDTDEASLKRNYIIGGEMKNANGPGMEGQGMGGHKFGNENHPPTGDDPANPSRNAGYTNGYFARTAPSEEHPENNNFKSEQQQGEPNYHTARSPEGDQTKDQEQHQHTNDQRSDHATDAPEIPGPNERPEQQKVGGA